MYLAEANASSRDRAGFAHKKHISWRRDQHRLSQSETCIQRPQLQRVALQQTRAASQVCSGVRSWYRASRGKPDLDELNVPDVQIGGTLPQASLISGKCSRGHLMAFFDAFPGPCSLSTPIDRRQGLQSITVILTCYRVSDCNKCRYCLSTIFVPCDSIADVYARKGSRQG